MMINQWEREPSAPDLGTSDLKMVNRTYDGEPSYTRDGLRFLETLGRLHTHQIWLMYMILASFVVLGNYVGTSEWKLTQWWFSYDLGFVKRGLMGTLLKPLSNHLGHVTAANLASAAILSIATVALVSAATAFTIRQRANLTSWLVSAALITMPGTIAALARDFGRYDGVLVLILVWSIWTAWQIIERPRILLGTALVVAQIVGVLVHEIHSFITSPAILAVLLIRWHVRKRLAHALIIGTLAITCLATVIVGVFGRVTAYDADVLFEMAAADLSFDPVGRTIVILTRSFSENVTYAMERWSSPAGIAALGSTAFGLIPIAIVIVVLSRQMSWLNRLSVAGAALSPMLLTLLGVDIGRWAMFASLNAILVTMVAMDTNRERGDRSLIPAPQTVLLAYSILLGAVLGGMVDTQGIPGIQDLARLIQPEQGS